MPTIPTLATIPSWSVLVAAVMAAYAVGFLVGRSRASRGTAAPPPRDLPLPSEEVVRLTAEGKVIDAIRTYREQTGAGLKESKDVIDQLRAKSV